MSRVVVVGAGVIGLATGRAFANEGHEVFVLEKEALIGSGVSSRNSEVIHAGIYYRTGSLMHRHCVAGRRLLYDYLEARDVPFRKCGKLIVATSDAEAEKLDSILERALTNGVEGMSRLSRAEAVALEPNLRCTGALLSSETGIVDSHAYMSALRDDIESAGGFVVLNTPVQRIERRGAGWRVAFGGADPDVLDVDIVVNCAGLAAQSVAGLTPDYPPEAIPRQTLAKGNYFRCTARPAFTRLIYPVPMDGGLGVHLTLDLGGRMRFGPDVEWVEREEYSVDPGRSAGFYDAVRTYWPGLPDDSLAPDYCGIRPKLRGPGEPDKDFVVTGPAEHGLAGLVQTFGIESPGLTSSLSLADLVLETAA